MSDLLDLPRRREPLADHPWAAGRELYLVELSAAEAVAAGEDRARFALWVTAFGLRDGDGRRVFNDGDIARLADTPFRLIAPIAERVQRLSGMLPDQEEDERKNSGATAAAAGT